MCAKANSNKYKKLPKDSKTMQSKNNSISGLPVCTLVRKQKLKSGCMLQYETGVQNIKQFREVPIL